MALGFEVPKEAPSMAYTGKCYKWMGLFRNPVLSGVFILEKNR